MNSHTAPVPLRTLIVEDDPVQMAFARNYVERCPLLKWVGSATMINEAQRLLGSVRVDLLLLDIGLAGQNGFRLLDGSSRKPVVIVSTADPGNALKGFDVGVADLLVKPYSFPRFLRAVQRAVFLRDHAKEPLGASASLEEATSIVLQSGRSSVTVLVEDVFVVESAGNYVRIHLRGGERHIVNATMEMMVKLLDGKDLLRIHRRYIVACSAVLAVAEGKVETPVGDIPIGKSYRKAVVEWLEHCAQVHG